MCEGIALFTGGEVFNAAAFQRVWTFKKSASIVSVILTPGGRKLR